MSGLTVIRSADLQLTNGDLRYFPMPRDFEIVEIYHKSVHWITDPMVPLTQAQLDFFEAGLNFEVEVTSNDLIVQINGFFKKLKVGTVVNFTKHPLQPDVRILEVSLECGYVVPKGSVLYQVPVMHDAIPGTVLGSELCIVGRYL